MASEKDAAFLPSVHKDEAHDLLPFKYWDGC